ncbi:MAG: radical SAM protein, partial [Lachnospiraceae bacterium]|nr:radical SAM protein [Lachnospiraceae bacterium]
DGVAFTGGEPCLHRDLPELMRKIRALGFAVKLDTNGYHPELLGQILDEGLADYVAMDVKNSPEKYAATCGVETMDLAPVRESIRLITEHGAGTGSGAAADERPGAEDDAPAFEYEFRTTDVKELHEAADFEEIGQMIRGARHYFLQSFTDRDTVPFGGFSAHTPEDLRRFAEIVRKYADDVQLRGVE